jgi:hypothetical protein
MLYQEKSGTPGSHDRREEKKPRKMNRFNLKSAIFFSTGEFMQGWFHGHGIYYTLDGTKFEGGLFPI